jgi:hypothetical protein
VFLKVAFIGRLLCPDSPGPRVRRFIHPTPIV